MDEPPPMPPTPPPPPPPHVAQLWGATIVRIMSKDSKREKGEGFIRRLYRGLTGWGMSGMPGNRASPARFGPASAPGTQPEGSPNFAIPYRHFGPGCDAASAVITRNAG